MKRRWWWSVSIASMMAGSVLVTPAAAGAGGAGWDVPVQVLSGSFRDVSAAVDGDGAVHLAAVGVSGVWYATDRTGSWDAEKLLEHKETSDWTGVSLALDEDGRVTIALSEAFPSKFGDLPGRIRTVTDQGRPRGDFSAPVAITPGSSSGPSLKTPDGHTYLARTGEVCFDVCEGPSSRVIHQTDGPSGWIRRTLPGDAYGPDLRVDDSGRPRLVYATTPFGATGKAKVLYASAPSRTGSFTTQLVAKAGQSYIDARLVLDDSGRPRVAWVQDPQGSGAPKVRFARRTTGGDWDTRAIGPGRAVAITVDAADRTHLAIGGADGVREVVVQPMLTTRTIDDGSRVIDVELRYPSTGSAMAAYIRRGTGAGVYVARR